MIIADSPPLRAGALPLVGGALALDFANTSSGRGGAQRLEHLGAPEHLPLWARHAGILPPDPADLPSLRPDVVMRAQSLREAIHRSAAALAAGADPAAADLAHIATWHADSLAHGTLIMAARRFTWHWDLMAEPEAAIFGPIAQSAVEVLTGSDLTRIKQCPGIDCGWVFLDLSKNRSRRWCEMEVCGARAKLRRYRTRHRIGSVRG